MKNLIPLLTICLLTSCASLSTHSVENTRRTIEVKNDKEKAYQIAYRAATELGWDITNSDADMHTFTGKTPRESFRKEDLVSVYVEASEDGSIVVVKSALGHKPNQEHIASYLESIKKQSVSQKEGRKLKLTIELPGNM